MKTKRQIGIYGGSFNPIHTGHLIVAEQIRDKAKLDKVIFIPVGIPPHKDELELCSFHRLEMVKLAIKSNPYFDYSDIEINSEEKNYTVNTLRKLQKKYNSDVLSLIIGEDSDENFHTWKDYKTILKKVEVLVFLRNTKTDFNNNYKNMKQFDTSLIEISATEIRENVKTDKSIKYLVNEDVEKYILKNNLYKR